MWLKEMSEVKVFRVIGEILKPNLETRFQKEIRATKPEDAIEQVYKEIGSKHRAKRYQIKINNVEEIDSSEIVDPIIRKLTLNENQN